MRAEMRRQAFHAALEHAWQVVREANGYIDRQAALYADGRRERERIFVAVRSDPSVTFIDATIGSASAVGFYRVVVE